MARKGRARVEDRHGRFFALGIVLSLIAVPLLGYAGLVLASYLPEPEDGSGATSLIALLLQVPPQFLVVFAMGIAAGIAGFGVLRDRRWGAVLAIGVGVALLLGGVVLLWVVIRELGIPGSFAILFLVPAAVALVAGTFVLWAALAARSHRH